MPHNMLQCILIKDDILPDNIGVLILIRSSEYFRWETKNPHTVRVSSVHIEYCPMLTSIMSYDIQSPFSC